MVDLVSPRCRTSAASFLFIQPWPFCPHNPPLPLSLPGGPTVPDTHRLPTQVSSHHLHSSSDDEDDRLKELSFPEEAVLQQVGRAGGSCPTWPHPPP